MTNERVKELLAELNVLELSDLLLLKCELTGQRCTISIRPPASEAALKAKATRRRNEEKKRQEGG